MGWAAFHDAPRDRDVWLYLPAVKHERDAAGRVTSVTNVVEASRWDKARSAWVSKATDHIVYPSLWHDAPVDGHAPELPDLN